MALIPCPECNHQVSDQAKACPNCGYGLSVSTQNIDPITPNPSGRSKKRSGCMTVIIIFVVLVLIGYLSSSDDSGSESNYSSQTTSLGTGKITTFADGTDVGKVNLWSSASSNRSVRCSVSNNTRVKIIKSDGPYYFVETSGGCRGYCMKGFVVRN